MNKNVKMCLWDKYPLMTKPDIATSTGAFTRINTKMDHKSGFVMHPVKLDSVNVLEKNPNVIQVEV